MEKKRGTRGCTKLFQEAKEDGGLTHPWLAYLTLFLAALLEAVPVVGSVIPGSTIILALSALVPGGDLKLQWVLLVAALGAVLGDGSAYWIGHRRQREILNTWPLTSASSRRPDRL